MTTLDASPGFSPPTPDADPPAVTVIEPKPGWRALDLRELWQYRELLYFLVWRDIKVRYKQTVIGVAWAVLQPVCSMAAFSIIFGRLAKLPSDGAPYPIFVYAGLLPWLFFSNSVAQASQSLVGQTQLLTKVYFPRLYMPASSIGVRFVDFVFGFAVYLALMAFFQYSPGPGILLVPALLALTALTATGIGVFLASLTVIYRDFRYAVPFTLQLWMYLTPIVYPLSLVPERYQWLMLLNPMTGVIEGFRSALLGRPLPWLALAASCTLALLLTLFGALNFRRTERRFADVA